MSQSPAGASSDEPGPSTDAPSSSEDSLHIDQPAHAATDAALAPSAKQPQIINATLAHPLALGFTATLGGILAIALAMALNSLSSILVSITLALFIALGLDPIVRSLQRRGLSRALALLVVSVVTVGFFVAVLAIVVPIVARQFTIFLQDLPTFFDDFIGSATYLWLVDNLGDGLSTVVAEVESFVLNPATLGAISGGVLQAGISLLTGLVSALVVIVLTLYFTASLDAMKQALSAAGAAGNAAAQASSFVVYPEAPHAFHADYRPSYRQQAAEDGWERMLAWFKTHGAG